MWAALRACARLVFWALLMLCYGLFRLVGLIDAERPENAFSDRKRWALALAQPMVDALSFTGFHDPDSAPIDESSRGRLRTALLHQLEYRSDASDDQVRAHLVAVLEAQWFRADLHSLLPADDPRDALAFACVRMALLVRSAMLMGWTDEMAAWRVLLLNAQRAQDCFDSWDDFGAAFARGRKQWVSALRADPLGRPLGDDDLRALLAAPGGAWSALPWPGLLAFDPQHQRSPA